MALDPVSLAEYAAQTESMDVDRGLEPLSPADQHTNKKTASGKTVVPLRPRSTPGIERDPFGELPRGVYRLTAEQAAGAGLPSWADLLPPEQARAKLDAAMRDTIAMMAGVRADGAMPAVLVRATAGLGKNDALWRALGERAPLELPAPTSGRTVPGSDPGRIPVLYLAPRRDLAEQELKRAAAVGLRARRWRSRLDAAEDGEPMCVMHDQTRALYDAGRGADVGRLCQTVVCGADGREQTVHCDAYGACRFRRQTDDVKHLAAAGGIDVLIATHRYLTLGAPAGMVPGLVVVDERFDGLLIGESRIGTAALAATTANGRPGAELHAIRDRLAAWMAAHIDHCEPGTGFDFAAAVQALLQTPLAAYVGEALLACEKRADLGPYIRPNMAVADLPLAGAGGPRAAAEARSEWQFWTLVVREIERQAGLGPDRIAPNRQVKLLRVRARTDSGEAVMGRVLRLSYRLEPAKEFRGRPLVALDATGDVEMLRPHFPDLAWSVERVDAAQPGIRRILIPDSVVSDTQVLGGGPGTLSKTMVAQLVRTVADHIRQGRQRVAIASTTMVERMVGARLAADPDLRGRFLLSSEAVARHGAADAFHACDAIAHSGTPLLKNLVEEVKVLAGRHQRLAVLATMAVERAIVALLTLSGDMPANLVFGHFGAQRGMNMIADCDGYYLIGRLQPPPEQIESGAMALWGDAAEPPPWLNPTGGEETRYPHHIGYYHIDGEVLARAHVPMPEDARMRAVLAQIREAELIQADGRARGAHRTTPAYVYHRGAIPLELPYDEVLPAAAIVGGYGRLETARRKLGGILPASKTLLAELSARAFGRPLSEDAANQILRRAGLTGIGEMVEGWRSGADDAEQKGTDSYRNSYGVRTLFAGLRIARVSWQGARGRQPYVLIDPDIAEPEEAVRTLLASVGKTMTMCRLERRRDATLVHLIRPHRA
ncbi:MAG: hypothetical protein ACLGJC_00440 [Alphaproteobacteria bacterium]